MINDGGVPASVIVHETHVGPTMGWLGILGAVFVLPVVGSTVLWFIDSLFIFDFSSWVICAPVFVGCLVALIISSAARIEMPLMLRISWSVIIVGVCAFLAILCIEIEGTKSMQFLLDWVTTTTPHWIISVLVLICGVIQLAMETVGCRNCRRSSRACCSTMCCCGCCGLCLQPKENETTGLMSPRGDPASSESRENRRLTNITTGIMQLVVGFIWGATAILVYYASNKYHAAVSWNFIFIPWYILDAFSFFLFAVMLFFSFGAMESSVLTISQQCLLLLCIASGALFKALLAFNIETALFGVPSYVMLISALWLEFCLIALGFSFSCSRNSNIIVLGSFLGEDIRHVKNQLKTMSFQRRNSINSTVQHPYRPSTSGPSSSSGVSRSSSQRRVKRTRRDGETPNRRQSSGLRKTQRALTSNVSSTSDSTPISDVEP